MPTGPDGHVVVESVEQLRTIVEPPHPLMADKAIDRVDAATAEFLAVATFYLLATQGADGTLDMSPRGDVPGVIQVLDDGTRIAIPDRGGNRRLDSMHNILRRPRVGMLFMVPGVEHSLRINGSARIVATPAVLDAMGRVGARPELALLLDIEELFLHCGRSLKRAALWDPPRWPNTPVPSPGAMFKSQLAVKGIDVG